MNTSDEIGDVLQRKAAALLQRSAPKLLELLEPNFVYVTASGRRLGRDAYIENGTGPKGLHFQSQEIDRFEVAEFGDTAIATMILLDRFEFEGRLVSETYRSSACSADTGPDGCGRADRRAWRILPPPVDEHFRQLVARCLMCMRACSARLTPSGARLRSAPYFWSVPDAGH